ncbi:MAG TPA: 4Fe-4S dicluster domain-containing protein [Dongiaceae bacterium]|jgi:ferredoxin|nr:4Fe-4S dicluster domain-containing protein [Dongiaceae bacterium]
MQTPSAVVISRDSLQALIDALAGDGYRVLGPRVHEGAIVYDHLARVGDLPEGWTDRQDAGRYRLERRDDRALFGFVVGPQSWKRFLHPSQETMWTMRRSEQGGVALDPAPEPREKFAFIGVRACELAAIAVHDRVFVGGTYADLGYATRRANAFIVAVNCGEAGGTCFCVSMETGPKAKSGFDLALTELIAKGRHDFLVETGSEAGAAVLARIPQRPASAEDLDAAAAATARAAGQMGRRMETEGLKELLQANLEHPRWDQVAERCLTCGNCTMVCPTCFCTTIEEQGDLAGASAARVKKWDSCFTLQHSYIHGGSVRQSARSRYRQWMTHKLASWIDQFGTSGCVGCGRCITWCPVGIDITEEAAAIRATPGAVQGVPHGRP